MTRRSLPESAGGFPATTLHAYTPGPSCIPFPFVCAQRSDRCPWWQWLAKVVAQRSGGLGYIQRSHIPEPGGHHFPLWRTSDRRAQLRANGSQMGLYPMGVRSCMQWSVASVSSPESILSGHREPGDGHISVLSPVGLALLGLKVGATARWCSPSGEVRHAKVISVTRAAQAAA